MRKFLAIFLVCFFAFPAFSEDVQYVNRDLVSFKGSAQAGTNIIVYVNGIEVQRIQADASGEWRATNVRLDREGENVIYAKAIDEDGNESTSSKILRLFLDRRAAELNVSVLPEKARPRDILSIKVSVNKNISQVNVAMPNGDVKRLAFNDESATWQGNWKVPADSSSGTFTAVAVVTDEAGNTTQENSNPFTIIADKKLTIINPQDGEITYDTKITVQGLAESTEFVVIKGQQVPVDSGNHFQFVADLDSFGQNNIEVASYSNLGLSQKTSVSVVRLVTFPDIKESEVRSEIEFLATLGFVSALPESELFGPDYKISREEAVRILVLAGKSDLYDPKISSYKDVKRNNETFHYVESATATGIAYGYPKGVFHPKSYLTRAEAVALLIRFSGESASKRGRAEALDMPASHWATKYLTEAKRLNLLPPQWRKASRFSPNELITRAEFSALMARVPSMRRKIAALIKRDPNFESITNAFAVDAQDQPKGVETEENNLPKRYPLSESSLSATHILKTVALPNTVYQGSSIKIYVNTMQKMRRVTLFMPDHRQYVMNFDTGINRYVRTLTVDGEHYASGSYSYEVMGEDERGQQYLVRSNPFEVLPYEVYREKLKNDLSVQLDPVIIFPEFEKNRESRASLKPVPKSSQRKAKVGQPGFIYPEDYARTQSQGTRPSPTPKPVQTSAPRRSVVKAGLPQPIQETSKVSPRLKAMIALKLVPLDAQAQFQGSYVMTRAKTAFFVARPLGLAYGRLVLRPARDVLPGNIYAYAIQQSITRGWLKTVDAGFFRPQSGLTRRDAAALFTKLGLPSQIGDEQLMTQAEFFEAFSYVPQVKARVDQYLRSHS